MIAPAGTKTGQRVSTAGQGGDLQGIQALEILLRDFRVAPLGDGLGRPRPER